VLRGDRRRSAGWAAVAALVPLGCSSFGTPTEHPPFPASGVHVEVYNGRPDDMTVYAYHAGHRERLGDVPGGNTVRFVLDWTEESATYFEFDPARGATCRTRTMAVAGGEALYVWMEFRSAVQNDGARRSCDMRRER